MNHKLRSIVSLIVVALVMMTATGAIAQSSTVRSRANEIELTGVLTARNATMITVSGRVINIARAEINGSIGVGVLVKVHYSIAANGTLVAREVEAALMDDRNNDVNDDDSNHDLNDDHGGDNSFSDDGPNHDLNDDRGGNDDGVLHDVNDDRGGNNNVSDDNSGRGRGGNNDNGGHHGGRDD